MNGLESGACMGFDPAGGRGAKTVFIDPGHGGLDPGVVGMAGVIHDDDARSFSVGFYRARGNRRSVGNALDHAVATLAAKQLADEHVPRLRTRDGVDARQVVLTSAT